ncbi:MAG: cytochrome c [Gammaproteobacteria bacterium]|nr:cytochrome c [Gammaproteobacteria bacterium]
MKMFSLFILSVSLLLIQTVNATDSSKTGQQLYKDNCASCHGTSGGMDMSKRVAPPIIAVRMHYIRTYADKDSFVMAVADWVEKQDADNSLMRGAIRRFNIMPPISISRADAEKIAAYIYDGDVEKPEGFQQHFEERHGKNKKY